MEKKNKKKLLMFSIIGILLISISISFAYWQVILKQENTNVITSECFQINYIDGNAISILDAHPVSDEEGMQNVLYDFTITNVCNSSAAYQINLETLSVNGKQLPEKYLKINLMEDTISKITSKLLNDIEVEPTLKNATKAYKLVSGVLDPNEEKTFHLRLWMHGEVLATDLDSMNATYNGKVSVITSYTENLPTLVETIKNIPIVTEGDGLYEVGHDDAEITYTSDVTAINNLKQTEYRYAGLNPDNYVSFNNELWRIIGLVNTPEGSRIKIIRNDIIGKYPWDTSASNINGGSGVNEWTQSKAMSLLNNGPYYNRNSGTCYEGMGNVPTTCDFSEIGLLEESKSMIDTIVWNTGSNGDFSFDNINTKNFYNLERSNNTGKICSSYTSCNDNIERTTTWVGKVGLMYPSDYGYATSDNNQISRETCLNTATNLWAGKEFACQSYNWLSQSYKIRNVALLSPMAVNYAASRIFSINSGRLGNSYASSVQLIPSLYLKLRVKYIQGNGAKDSPYILSL